MTFKQFRKWCNERACDGAWGPYNAVICLSVAKAVRRIPFWRRERFWRKIDEDLQIVETFVEPVNKKIEEYLKGE